MCCDIIFTSCVTRRENADPNQSNKTKEIAKKNVKNTNFKSQIIAPERKGK